MNKALIVTALILLVLPLEITVVEADVVDQTGGLIAEAPYITSPTNSTYDSGVLLLNVSFHAVIYGNLDYTVTYNVDDSNNETMPLTAHYFGFNQQEKNYLDGSVTIPQLQNGSHKVSVYVEAESTTNPNNQTVKKTFRDSQTVFFTLNNTTSSSPTPMANLYSEWIPYAIIAAVVVVAFVALGALVYLKKRKRN